jgi:hypothetical protein
MNVVLRRTCAIIIIIIIIIIITLQSFVGHFFSFLILYTVGKTPWTGDQPIARPLPTHRTTQRKHKRRQTSMP